MFRKSYGEVFEGDETWNELPLPEGDRYAWDDDSTYVKRPPYFEGMPADPPDGFDTIEGARILALLGDSVTTDHISPAGAIKQDTPAGRYLNEHGVEKKDFNSYGSRRGNHEVMMRGTFANVRLRNLLAPGTEGGYTTKLPEDEEAFIFDAAMQYAEEDVPLGVLAGKEYGSGSSRDWAAKGPRLQGIRFAIAESYERIHRSNLVGMGVLPLQFPEGESVESLGLTGREVFDLAPLEDGARELEVTAKPDDGEPISSPPASGSTRRTSGSTTATAGSSTSCSGSCCPATEAGVDHAPQGAHMDGPAAPAPLGSARLRLGAIERILHQRVVEPAEGQRPDQPHDACRRALQDVAHDRSAIGPRLDLEAVEPVVPTVEFELDPAAGHVVDHVVADRAVASARARLEAAVQAHGRPGRSRPETVAGGAQLVEQRSERLGTRIDPPRVDVPDHGSFLKVEQSSRSVFY